MLVCRLRQHSDPALAPVGFRADQFAPGLDLAQLFADGSSGQGNENDACSSRWKWQRPRSRLWTAKPGHAADHGVFPKAGASRCTAPVANKIMPRKREISSAPRWPLKRSSALRLSAGHYRIERQLPWGFHCLSRLRRGTAPRWRSRIPAQLAGAAQGGRGHADHPERQPRRPSAMA